MTLEYNDITVCLRNDTRTMIQTPKLLLSSSQTALC